MNNEQTFNSNSNPIIKALEDKSFVQADMYNHYYYHKLCYGTNK